MAIPNIAIISGKVGPSDVEIWTDYSCTFLSSLTIDESYLAQILNSSTITNLLIRDMKASSDIFSIGGSFVDTVILPELISCKYKAAGATRDISLIADRCIAPPHFKDSTDLVVEVAVAVCAQP
jgi:hypothetical protein